MVISGIVNTIQSEVANVVLSLQAGYSDVDKGTNQMETREETFVTINNAVREMADRIKLVTTNLSTISEDSKKMNSSVEEIISISEESAAGVEETSASAQQSSSTMEEVTNSSAQLSKLAEELNGLVRKFKL